MHNKAMAWLIDPANVAVVEADPEAASDETATDEPPAEVPTADAEKDKG